MGQALTSSTAILTAVLTIFLTAFLIVLGGPKRAGPLYPAFLARVPLELKLALGLAVTAASCIVAGASFACLGLLRARSGGAFEAAMTTLLLCAVAALGVGPLTCELIWAWMIGPVDGGRPASDFLRWSDENRFGAMMLLRWAGAFAIFFFSCRAPGSWDTLLLGIGLVVYGVMLGFVDAATLRGLRRPLPRAD